MNPLLRSEGIQWLALLVAVELVLYRVHSCVVDCLHLYLRLDSCRLQEHPTQSLVITDLVGFVILPLCGLVVVW